MLGTANFRQRKLGCSKLSFFYFPKMGGRFQHLAFFDVTFPKEKALPTIFPQPKISGGPLLTTTSLEKSPPQNICKTMPICTIYRIARVSKRARRTSLYHSRQCGIVLKPHLDCLCYTIVWFMTRDCSSKLRKKSTSAS